MELSCPICQNDRTREIHGSFPGYVKGSSYHVFTCDVCCTQYAGVDDSADAIYNLIYNHGDVVPGYERYYDYAKRVRTSKRPLRLLAREDAVYAPVYDLCRGKNHMRILEVGCGYGYTTYAMRKCGHDVTGIDLSRSAIDFAHKTFGGDFRECTVSDLANGNGMPFDAIVATELIEHLPDLHGFIKDCLNLLEQNGRIILTTPNRDYYGTDAVWQTDLPPVHVFWLGRESFRRLAEQHGLCVEFADLAHRVFDRGNNLIELVRACSGRTPVPVIEANGSPNPARAKHPLWKAMRWAVQNPVARTVSNAAHCLIAADNPTLGVSLWRE